MAEDIILSVRVSPQAETMLKDLRDTGLFGLWVGDVVQRLLYERLRELVTQGWVEIPPTPQDEDRWCGTWIVGRELERNEVLALSVHELELSVRLSNILDTAGIKTIGDVVDRKSSDFLKMPHFGKRTMRELVDALEKQGVVWG